MDVHNKEQRSKNMSAIRSKGTKIEITLAKALWAKGYHYRKNDKTIFGKPDLTFKGIKLAIFVDSEFWHGKDWNKRKYDFKSNQEFWHKKIERNIRRDKEVNQTLKKDDWKVIRIWGKQIENKLDLCVNKIGKIIIKQKDKHLWHL